MNRHARISSRAIALATLVFLVLPGAAAAHAELESAAPADGAVLDAPPAEIVFTYTEELDPDSTLVVVDAAGTEVARTGVDPADELAMRIEAPDLAPGVYEVRSTAIAAHDGAIDRETVSFTILAPTPSPTEAPTPTPEPSETAAATPSPSPSPSASPSAAGETPTSETDVLIPVLAVGLIALAFGAWLMRNRARRAG
jgi:methionine-rich copper-binding protein CopC